MPLLPRKVQGDVTKRLPQVPRLPRKVGRRHRPPEPPQCRKCQACDAKCRSMAPSATPATQSESRCRQVPRLPRKVVRRHRKPSTSPEPSAVIKCHASHAKSTWMSPSATPATQSDGGCRQVLRLPRKVKQRHREPGAPPKPAQCSKCHTCHAKCRSMHQVPCLPRKVKVDVAKCTPATQSRAASPGTKRATRASPVP